MARYHCWPSGVAGIQAREMGSGAPRKARAAELCRQSMQTIRARCRRVQLRKRKGARDLHAPKNEPKSTESLCSAFGANTESSIGCCCSQRCAATVSIAICSGMRLILWRVAAPPCRLGASTGATGFFNHKFATSPEPSLRST